MKQTKSALSGKTLNLADNMEIKSNNFNVDSKGNMTCNNAKITGGNIIVGGSISESNLEVRGSWFDNNTRNVLQPGAMRIHSAIKDLIEVQILKSNSITQGGIDLWSENADEATQVYARGISTPSLTQTSLAENKKNFEKLQNKALEIIKNIDIYKYNLKGEKDTDKKHIGFVIGDNYNYSKEVTSLDNTGVDTYSFVSLCCKAIQEQQEQIEELKKEINKLKGEKNG